MTLRGFCLDTVKTLAVASALPACYKRIKYNSGKKEVRPTETEYGIFAAKLRELEEEYLRLQGQIRLFQGKSLPEIRQEQERLREEYRSHQVLLDEMARSCRCPAMARLAQLQRDYGQQEEQLLKTGVPEEGKSGQQDGDLDQAEAMALRGEFAIDFAAQAIRCALITALEAMELQMQAEMNTMKGECNIHE